MLISEAIKRENNNLNFIRLWLAFTVIVGHINVFISSEGPRSLLTRLFPFTYCGNIAVVTFFFFSGLLVTNSLFQKQNTKQYILSRFLRIYPALFFVVSISAFICFFWSSSDITVYAKNALEYIKHTFFVGYYTDSASQIPMVTFMRDGYPLNGQYATYINGSLWVLPYEVRLYVVLLGLFWLYTGIQKYGKHIVTALLVCGILFPLMSEKQIFGGESAEAMYLLPCFSFGSLLALYKDKIYLDYRLPISLFIIGGALYNFQVSHLFLFFAINLSLLYLSTLNWIKKIPVHIDISYGVYIWGWFVQQIVQYYGYAYLNYYSYAVVCIFLASAVAVISYYLVEKPCLKLKNLFEARGLKDVPDNG